MCVVASSWRWLDALGGRLLDGDLFLEVLLVGSGLGARKQSLFARFLSFVGVVEYEYGS